MALSRRTGRYRITLALLVVSSITLITLDHRGTAALDRVRDAAAGAVGSAQGTLAAAGRPFANAWSGITRYGELEAENERLRRELRELEFEGGLDAAAAEELATLLAELRIEWVGDLPRVTARVVAGPASNFVHTIEIDKGAEHGVRVGQPVVAGAGLAGRVVRVTAHRATVRTIMDPDFAVGVAIAGDGARGTARGDGAGGGALVVDTALPADARVPARSLVVTAGSAAFPASIPVGRVTGRPQGSEGLNLLLEAEPLVDVSRLSHVTVLLWGGEG